MTSTVPASDHRARYLRPIKLSIFFAVLGEAALFVVFGLILYPEGNIVNKLLWTVVFCGLGMGGAGGAMIVIFVVDRITGMKAILSTTLISVIMVGVACNYLCLTLDQTFRYFGGAENSALFISSSVIMSALGGAVIGWLCFTDRGRTYGRQLFG